MCLLQELEGGIVSLRRDLEGLNGSWKYMFLLQLLEGRIVSLRRDLEGGRNSSWIIHVTITGA
jgi:hypothetical protein